MSRAVMQQALAYIEEVDYGPYDKWPVILALKQALAEPEQEPVAWVLVTPYGEEDDIFYTEPETVPDGWSYKPLYDTAPTPRKPLTDEETRGLADKHLFYQPEGYEVSGIFNFARAIERAHGIGEQHE